MSIARSLKKHPVGALMYALFFVIILILFFDFSRTPALEMDPTDPYVLATKGQTIVERETTIDVGEKEKFFLLVGDTVRTLADSAATVFWPDGSVTRLGANTEISINEVEVDARKALLRIDFSIHKGKTWSNVITYLFGESYFHQRFHENGALAAVRGTVFEVNLDKGYIHTVDHAIALIDTETQEEVVVSEWAAVSTEDFLQKIQKQYLDATWALMNQTADSEYIKQKAEATKAMLLKSIEESSMVHQLRSEVRTMFGLSDEQLLIRAIMEGDETSKQQLLDALKEGNENGSLNRMLLDLYVMVNYFPNEEANANMKIQLRDYILQTATPEQKEYLLNDFARHTLYDYWSSLQSHSLDQAKNLNAALESYIQQGASIDLLKTLQQALGGDITSLLQGVTDGSVLHMLGERGSGLLKHLQTEDYAKKINDRIKNLSLEDINAINNKTEAAKQGIIDWILGLMR